jgi:hypothetical protein
MNDSRNCNEMCMSYVEHTQIYAYNVFSSFDLLHRENIFHSNVTNSRNSSLGMVKGYKLQGRGTGVQFLAGARDFPLLHQA